MEYLLKVLCHKIALNHFFQERIVNGIDGDISNWPWIVDLVLSSGHQCGGSAINDEWILTAAHCCAHGNGLQVRIELIENKLTCYLIIQRTISASFFDHDFSDPEGSFEIRAEKIINHPEYDETQGNMDFCLIKPKIQIFKKKNMCLFEIMEEVII